jgi:hypothetical protein
VPPFTSTSKKPALVRFVLGADQPEGMSIFSVPYPPGVAHAVGPFVKVKTTVFPDEAAVIVDGDSDAVPGPTTGVLVIVTVGVGAMTFTDGEEFIG